MGQSQYTQTGVNIDAMHETLDLMKAAVQSTYTEAVLSETGSFGGLFDLRGLADMQRPVLVASTDGVGTKTLVAAAMHRWDSIGQDLVNHCINDILVQGARPLFFMDYVAASALEPAQVAAIVGGMAQACRESGCALLGGETAEMPGVYESGAVDVVGTVVGVVDHDRLIDGSRITEGDIILSLPSSGLHTNGYSLARRVLAELDWQVNHADLGQSVGEALLAVHRCYLQQVNQLLAAGIQIRGLAHITGGGVVDNLPRILPEGTQAVIQTGTWPIPPIFTLIQQLGDVPLTEMWRVFNMGLGMLVVIPADQRELALNTVAELSAIGHIETGEKQVVLRD